MQKKKKSTKRADQTPAIKTSVNPRGATLGRIFSVTLGVLMLFGLVTQALGIQRSARIAVANANRDLGMVVLTWHKQNPDSSVCGDLTIHANGGVEKKTCVGDQATSYPQYQLSAEQLKQLKDWVNWYAPFQVSAVSSLMEVNVEENFTLQGQGQQTANADTQKAIARFAEEVFGP